MTEPQSTSSEFERGKEAGRVAQILGEHSEHLAKINGSVADSAKELAALTSEVRSLREEANARAIQMQTELKLLSTETEHRRSKLANKALIGEKAVQRRRRVITVVITITVGFALIAVIVTALSLAD